MSECAVCHCEAADMEHTFVEGDPQNPSRTWTIVAPLYFLPNDDNSAKVEGYCGPKCSLQAVLDRQRANT